MKLLKKISYNSSIIIPANNKKDYLNSINLIKSLIILWTMGGFSAVIIAQKGIKNGILSVFWLFSKYLINY